MLGIQSSDVNSLCGAVKHSANEAARCIGGLPNTG